MRSSRSGHKEHSTPQPGRPTHTPSLTTRRARYRSLPLPLRAADCRLPCRASALPCPAHAWPRLDWQLARWPAPGWLTEERTGQGRVRSEGWMDAHSPPIGDWRWGFGSMQLDCRCQGQKCRYARGMQRRQSSGGNHAREALSAHWPRPAAPLIIAALASAQFQRSGTRTQSAASPVSKRRERVGHPIWQPWQLSCCLSSSPLPLLAAQPNEQDRSRSRPPASVLSLAPAPIDAVQI